MRRAGSLVMLLLVACGAGSSLPPASSSVGDAHAGDYSLGPVAFSGSFHNSCAPYTADLEKSAGEMLAGLGMTFNGDGSLCDACILVKSAKGRSVVAHVVTTGETNGPNDIDLSQAAFNALNAGEYPRAMTWELVKCPPAGTLRYQFQTEANPWWTSLWVRGARLPVKSVEVKSANHPSFTPLSRNTDGTLNDAAGFGEGAFTLRVTAADGQTIVDSFPGFTAGAVLSSPKQFE